VEKRPHPSAPGNAKIWAEARKEFKVTKMKVIKTLNMGVSLLLLPIEKLITYFQPFGRLAPIDI
jgi:hypothetical protein